MERTFRAHEALKTLAAARPALFETPDGLDVIAAVTEAKSLEARAFVTLDQRYIQSDIAPIIGSLNMRVDLPV